MFFFDWRIGLLACLGIALFLLCNSALQKKSQEVSPKRQAAQEDLVGATLEYIQGMGIVKSFNLGGGSNQKIKQAIEESRTQYQTGNRFRTLRNGATVCFAIGECGNHVLLYPVLSARQHDTGVLLADVCCLLPDF